MQTMTDPGELGAEVLATSLAGELQELRYAVYDVKKALDPHVTQWYETPQGLGWVNMKSYGAVGDGVTNDRSAIQNAFNAAASGSKTIYFPTGTYYVGSHAGSTNIIDLSALGNGLQIRTGGSVELLTTTQTITPGSSNFPRFFYLANNSDFYCDPIAFRDTNYDSSDATASSGDNQGAVGFYLQNTTPTNWGRLYFTRIYATTITAPMICAQKSGTGGDSSNRVRDIFVGQVIANDTYYGINFQNEGDNLRRQPVGALVAPPLGALFGCAVELTHARAPLGEAGP
jgi:hypothetical protein